MFVEVYQSVRIAIETGALVPDPPGELAGEPLILVYVLGPAALIQVVRFLIVIDNSDGQGRLPVEELGDKRVGNFELGGAHTVSAI